MGTIRNVAALVLLISFLTFVAFFGRLPALSTSVVRLAKALWNDRHPLIMIFFILILSVSEILFLPPAWPLLSTSQKLIGPVLIILPYLFLYAAAASDPGYITRENHTNQMCLYPYDFTLFHPGQSCGTCHILKPARSKHCRVCKQCISKLDHHCAFINNCVGYRNQHWFLLLLFTTATLTTYATYVGASLLSSIISERISSWSIFGSGFTWGQYFQIWTWAMQEKTRIGAVTLLCLLTSPLIWGLLGYHIYLIWAGTTTNESMKWSDLQSDMADGYVFVRGLPADRQKAANIEPQWTPWPAESGQIVLRTKDGQPPRGAAAIGVGEWEQIWKLANLVNIYDLGFWDNLSDTLFPRPGS